MLRAVVIVLLLANLGFWAWRDGWLAPLHELIGARPEGDREPERLALQIRPDAVQLIPAEAASSAGRAAVVAAAAATPGSSPTASAAGGAASAASTSASTSAASTSAPPPTPTTACLEAGPFGPAEIVTAEAVVKAALPDGGWTRRELGPTWWVALGPYEDAELLQKKRFELRRRGIAPALSPYRPGGAPVLVVSRHDNQAAADSALLAWNERGVRSGRVLPVSLTQSALRVARADAATQGLLAALPTDRLRGRSFTACPDAN